jgi:hypothetical protein
VESGSYERKQEYCTTTYYNWRALTSEMGRRVVCYKFTDVLEERTASIFRIEE